MAEWKSRDADIGILEVDEVFANGKFFFLARGGWVVFLCLFGFFLIFGLFFLSVFGFYLLPFFPFSFFFWKIVNAHLPVRPRTPLTMPFRGGPCR